MNVPELLIELLERIPEHVREAVEGLDADQLTTAPASGTNPVAWLVWHLTRVQDHHVAELLEEQQIWISDGWAPRFGLDADPSNTGYGHSVAEVGRVRPERPRVLIDYYDAVAERTVTMVRGLTAEGLDAVVDDRWDPPVTLGVRLVSIIDDDIQHAGQAAYVRGLVLSR